MPIIPSRRKTIPAETRLAIRIDLAPGVRIGPGKVRLLEEIDRAGSIAAAARVMRMTYTHAWGMLDDLSKALGRPLFATVIGGDDGGGARLTKAGKIMVAEYRAIEAATATAARDNLAMLEDGYPASSTQGHGQYDSHDRPRYMPMERERRVRKRSKMPGLVKVAEKRDQARIARVTASVSPELARDVGLPLSRGWSPLECALYLAQMMPSKDRAVLHDLLVQLRRPGRPTGS